MFCNSNSLFHGSRIIKIRKGIFIHVWVTPNNQVYSADIQLIIAFFFFPYPFIFYQSLAIKHNWSNLLSHQAAPNMDRITADLTIFVKFTKSNYASKHCLTYQVNLVTAVSDLSQFIWRCHVFPVSSEVGSEFGALGIFYNVRKGSTAKYLARCVAMAGNIVHRQWKLWWRSVASW